MTQPFTQSIMRALAALHLASWAISSCGCIDIGDLDNQGERLVQIAIDELPRLPSNFDRLNQDANRHIEDLKVRFPQDLGIQGRLAMQFANESVLVGTMNQASDAVRRAMVRAAAEDLDNTQIMAAVADELKFRPVTPLPVAVSYVKDLVIRIPEGSNEAEPLHLELSGFGLDRRVADDDWELSLHRSHKQLFIANVTDYIIRGNGGLSARVNVAKACRGSEFDGVEEGDYRLSVRNKYSDDGCLVELDAYLDRNTPLPTIAVKLDSFNLMPKWSKNVYQGSEHWVFPKYDSPDDVKKFIERVSDNDDVYSSVMVTVEVRYEIVDGNSLNVTVDGHMLEWKKDGTGPQADFSGGSARYSTAVPIRLPENCEAVAIAGRSNYGRSEHLMGDGTELKWNGQASDVIRAATGQMIFFHRSIPKAVMHIELHDVEVKYRKIQPKASDRTSTVELSRSDQAIITLPPTRQ